MAYDDDEDIGLDEIVGVDEIVGDDDDILDALVSVDGEFDDDEDDDDDDDDEDVGRPTSYRRRRRARRSRGRQARLAKLARYMRERRAVNPDALLVRKQPRNKIRLLILPIPKTTVAAGGTATINIQPQDLFRATRMLVPSSIAFDFDVLDIKVGQKPQFVQSGAMPAAVFSEVSVGSSISFDSADIGNILNIEIRNNSAGPLDFGGALLGTTAK